MEAVEVYGVPKDPIRHMQNMAGSLGECVVLANGTDGFSLEITDDNKILINDENCSSYAGFMTDNAPLINLLYKYPKGVKALCISCIEIFGFTGATFDAGGDNGGGSSEQIYVETTGYPAPFTEVITPTDTSLNFYKNFADGTKIFGQFKKLVMQTGVVTYNPVPATVKMKIHFGWELK